MKPAAHCPYGFRVISLNLNTTQHTELSSYSRSDFQPNINHKIALDCVYPVSVFRPSGVEIKGRQHSIV